MYKYVKFKARCCQVGSFWKKKTQNAKQLCRRNREIGIAIREIILAKLEIIRLASVSCIQNL